MNLPLIPQDKANHIIYGAAIALLACKAAVYAPAHLSVAPAAAALLAATVFGFVKEIADAAINYRTTGKWLQGPHSIEAEDVLATMSGGLLVMIAAQ